MTTTQTVSTVKELPKSQSRLDKNYWLNAETVVTTEVLTSEQCIEARGIP